MQRGRKSNRFFDYWVGTPLLNALATFHRRRPLPADIRKIGVMCSPALGDTLLLSGVLQDVRAAYPQARIVHICMKQNLAAAEIIPGSDVRLMIDLTKPRDTIAQLRAERFDVLLDFSSWQRLTAFYTLMSGAGYTVGFLTRGQNRSRGYDRTVKHRNDCHELENFTGLLHGSGLLAAAPSHAPMVQLGEIDALPFAAEHDLVVIHAWASGQRSWLREWPEERWVALAQQLKQDRTLFVVTGAPADASRIGLLVDSLRSAGLRAEGFESPDGFHSLTYLLQRSRLVISVNTGVMHLAAVAGARVIGLSGPTSDRRWGPRGPFSIGIQASGDDCGYLNLGFEFDGHATNCMERISVDQVLLAARTLQAADVEVG